MLATSASVSLAHEWRRYCEAHSEMHDTCRAYYRALNHGLMIPAILLGSGTSVGTIGVGSSDRSCGDTINWLLVTLGAAGLLSTCLISVHRLIGCVDLQREHDLYSDMYRSLTNEISMQLVLSNDDSSRMFVSTREYLKFCKNSMDVLIDKAPPIPKRVLKSRHIVQPSIGSVSCNLPV